MLELAHHTRDPPPLAVILSTKLASEIQTWVGVMQELLLRLLYGISKRGEQTFKILREAMQEKH